MTNMNQAFIEAYERIATQQAAPEVVSSIAKSNADQPLGGPHFQSKEAIGTRGPLSNFLSQRVRDVNDNEAATHVAGLPTSPAAASDEISEPRNHFLGETSNKQAADVAIELESTFEVTRFRWPQAAQQLAKSTKKSMVDLLDQIIATSTNVLALSSARQYVGLTTTALAFAITAKELGMKVALIDLCYSPCCKNSPDSQVNTKATTGQSGSNDSLVESLGIAKLRTLRDASNLGMSLGEAIVTSQQDQTAVLAVGNDLDARVASSAITRIAANNDFVLIDAGIVGAPERSLTEWIEPVQGASLLVDLSEGSRYDAARIAAANQLNESSPNFLGVIENLV